MPAVFSAATIVAIGTFNPDLFRAESLVDSKVISPAEADRSKIKALLSNRVVHYTLPWGELLVVEDRFQTTATEAPFIRVADLFAQAMDMAGTRSNLRAFGINFEAHFDLGSAAARDALAMKFAPPDAWGAWGRAVRASMELDAPDAHGGITVLAMREPFRVGDIRGWYDVTLTGSDKVPNFTGVRFITNHHHEYAPAGHAAANAPADEHAKRGTDILLTALAAAFDASIGKAESIFAEVLA